MTETEKKSQSILGENNENTIYPAGMFLKEETANDENQVKTISIEIVWYGGETKASLRKFIDEAFEKVKLKLFE